MSDGRLELIAGPVELAALEKINPLYRDAVLKYDYENYSYIEAAQLLGCKLNTFRQRLRRGRRNFRVELIKLETQRGLR